ncbi:hypothetical protein [Microbacterium gorillae]|uniref:hypothetical protein n=1 Tax=Microbacterium gorillae TaxID=1231063 RepID=UPI00058B7AC7|nr:hypothetical protein [Microbacterium gorillae]
MTSIATVGIVLFALCALAVVVIIGRAMPRGTFVIWALVLFFVPVWIGATAGLYFSAFTAMTIVAMAACGRRIRLVPADAVALVFVVLVFAMFALKLANLTTAVEASLEWMLPYAWGRMALARVGREHVAATISVVATVAAALAIIEAITHTNLFVELPPLGPSAATWRPLQYRGGELRVEGAWGHSIALGAGLAMSSAFVLAARWRTTIKLLMLAVIAAATALTLSRIGLVTLVLTVAVSIVTLPGLTRMTRFVVALLGLLTAVVLVPILSSVFLEAGDEAGGSADYRGDLFVLFGQVRLFGGAPDWAGLTVGGTYLGTYADSVDNALLVIALRVGWIPMLLTVALILMAALPTLRPGQANPAGIAVLAQIPALFAVALITQFGMYFWFLVGLAVTWHATRDEPPLFPVAADTARDALVRSTT